MSFLACSNCNEVIIKSHGDSVKLRAKILILNEKGGLAVCKGCNAEIQVPIKVDVELAKSLSVEKPKLYLKNIKK